MYLLFLVMCVFGNEECKALVDATLLEELLKLLLDLKVESFELTKQCDLRHRTSPSNNKDGRT